MRCNTQCKPQILPLFHPHNKASRARADDSVCGLANLTSRHWSVRALGSGSLAKVL